MRAYGRLLFLLASVGLISGALYLGTEPDWFKIRQPTVELVEMGEGGLIYQGLRADVEKNLASLSGESIWSVGLEDAMNLLEKDRRISSVQIQRRWPNQLRVLIAPREPVAIYWAKRGPQLLAIDGGLLPQVQLKELPDVPILRGESFAGSPELRQKAIELILTLPDKGLLSRESVSEVRYSKRLGFELALSRGGEVVRMGDEEYSRKISRVNRVLSYLQGQGLDGRVIDARFTKKVVVRLRNAP